MDYTSLLGHMVYFLFHIRNILHYWLYDGGGGGDQPMTRQHDADAVFLALNVRSPCCSLHKGSNEKPIRVKSFLT
jgi:hypothetical protein